MEPRNITISSTDEALTQTAAAEALGVTTMTIWRWIHSRKIMTVQFGHLKFVPKSEIERLKK